MMQKQKISYLKPLLLIAAIAFVIYSNSFGNQFVWDDEYLVENNFFIRSWNYLPRLFTVGLYHFAPDFQNNYYRPLQTLSYMADYSLWQFNVFGYHLTNLIFHTLNAVLIFSLLSLISKDRRISLIASLLFIAHPIHAEAVSYISGRADLLVSFFLLSSFILFIKYTDCSAPKRTFYYAGSVFSFILALLSKESALIFPLLLLVYDHCFPAQVRPLRAKDRIIYRYSAFFIAAGLYVLLRLTVLSFTGQLFTAGTNLYLRVLTLCKSIFVYLGLLIMPVQLHMERSIAVANSFFEPQVLICALLVFSVAGIVWIYRTRQRVIYFACLWFLFTLLPQSSLFFPEVIAEHFLYLPSIGLFLIFALFFSKPKRYTKLIFFPLLIFYSTLTWGQNINWKDPATFYRWTLNYAPNSAKAHNNMGIAYGEKGFYHQAISKFKRALEINPEYGHAHYNLGKAYAIIGLFGLAITEYDQALKINPESSVIRDNLISTCNIVIEEYKKELQSNPNSDILHYNLGVLYSRKGLTEEALGEYEQALKINPEFTKAYFNMGAIYANQGRLDEAIVIWEKALEIDPNYKKASSNISKAREYEETENLIH